MAIAISELTSAYNNADATSYDTASISPAAGSFLVVFYATRHATTAPACTVSGLSLSWTETEPEQVDSITAIGCWTAQCGNSPGSGALTLTMDGAVTAIGCSWCVLQVTGHDWVNTVVQSPIAGTGLTGTTGTVTYSALGNAANAQITHFIHRANSTSTLDASGSWVGSTDRAGGTPNHGSRVQWKLAAADLTSTMTWSSARWQGSGVEIKVAEDPRLRLDNRSSEPTRSVLTRAYNW